MAKKKKTSSGRAAKKRKRTTASKKPATKRAAAKKSNAKRKNAPAKASTSKGTKPKSAGATSRSVDGVLKKYERERSSQESQLATLAKKIEDLEAKTRSYQEQIEKLRTQHHATQDAIAQLDSRRDQEVAEMLSQLGVQLGGNGTSSFAQASVASATPPQGADDNSTDIDEVDSDDANGDSDEEATARSEDATS